MILCKLRPFIHSLSIMSVILSHNKMKNRQKIDKCGLDEDNKRNLMNRAPHLQPFYYLFMSFHSSPNTTDDGRSYYII